MARKGTGHICPICHCKDGFSVERCVKYTINVPQRANIRSLSDAWDYGARVYLRLAERMIFFPPSKELSISISSSCYEFWRRFTLHNDDGITLFESKLLNVIPKSFTSRTKYLKSKYNRITEFYDETPKHIRNPLHITSPTRGGIATRASVSLVFAACVCLALRDFFAQTLVYYDYRLTKAAYTFFSMFEMGDFRLGESWTGYFSIYGDIHKHGFYRASRLAKQVTNICKRCAVEMTQLDDLSWKCPECDGLDPIVRHFSIVHLKKKAPEIREKLIDVIELLPVFLDSVERLIYYLKSHPSVSISIMKLFVIHQLMAERGILLCTRRKFWKHYDNTKKSKIRWCSLVT